MYRAALASVVDSSSTAKPACSSSPAHSSTLEGSLATLSANSENQRTSGRPADPGEGKRWKLVAIEARRSTRSWQDLPARLTDSRSRATPTPVSLRLWEIASVNPVSPDLPPNAASSALSQFSPQTKRKIWDTNRCSTSRRRNATAKSPGSFAWPHSRVNESRCCIDSTERVVKLMVGLHRRFLNSRISGGTSIAAVVCGSRATYMPPDEGAAYSEQ